MLLAWLLCLTTAAGLACGQYTPDWASLDSRPLPDWYDRAKVGIFIHWGVFSVPSYGSEWFWINWETKKANYVDFMKKNYAPGYTYADFAPDFTAEFYDPDQWADIFNASGARYVVLTTKHHEGYTLWPSDVSFSWNAMDVGPHRDLVGDLAKAVRKVDGLHFGVYHSLMDWFHPLYLKDKAGNFSTRYFPKAKAIPELIELVTRYEPELIWSDGEWEAPDTYWGSKDFLAWLYNESPVKETVLVNDRWGQDCLCKHGGYWTCKDKYNPHVLMPRKWEDAMTLDNDSWGYRRNMKLSDVVSSKDLIKTLLETMAYGGNLLVNVGPTKEGTIPGIFEQRLRDMGKWLKVNGDAIYESEPWQIAQNDTATENVWYTRKDLTLYAMALDYPMDGTLTLGCVSEPESVKLLGYDGPISYVPSPRGTAISLPPLQQAPSTSSLGIVLALELSADNLEFTSCIS